MQKKSTPPIFKDRYFSYRVVLKEVWQEFQKRKEVSVIIGFHESKNKEDVRKYLSNLKIKVMLTIPAKAKTTKMVMAPMSRE